MKLARFAAAAAVVAIAAACHVRSDAEARDAGPAVDRNYTIGAFQRIEVSGPYEVTVRADGAPGVTAHGGSAVLDNTEVAVKDGALRIGQRDRKGFHWNWGHDGKVTVTVTGAGAIDGAAIAGSGGLRIDRVATPRFKGEVAGSGDLNVDSLQADQVDLGIAGSGNVKVAGKAGRVSMSIAGSGDLDAGGLQAADASVSVAGSGNVIAHASGSANIEIVGSGDVDLKGGAKCTVSKHGSGNVSCS